MWVSLYFRLTIPWGQKNVIYKAKESPEYTHKHVFTLMNAHKHSNKLIYPNNKEEREKKSQDTHSGKHINSTEVLW